MYYHEHVIHVSRARADGGNSLVYTGDAEIFKTFAAAQRSADILKAEYGAVVEVLPFVDEGYDDWKSDQED